MSRVISDGLRSRVLAVSTVGMSARSAAVRFGIGISPAIAWISNARQGQLISGKQANVPVPDWMSMRHLSLA